MGQQHVHAVHAAQLLPASSLAAPASPEAAVDCIEMLMVPQHAQSRAVHEKIVKLQFSDQSLKVVRHPSRESEHPGCVLTKRHNSVWKTSSSALIGRSIDGRNNKARNRAPSKAGQSSTPGKAEPGKAASLRWPASLPVRLAAAACRCQLTHCLPPGGSRCTASCWWKASSLTARRPAAAAALRAAGPATF